MVSRVLVPNINDESTERNYPRLVIFRILSESVKLIISNVANVFRKLNPSRDETHQLLFVDTTSEKTL